jgi:hypothetical protein
MENTIYYTFSTISQTLAGALGLLAAFMIIRLNAFNQRRLNVISGPPNRRMEPTPYSVRCALASRRA